jgi:8-oxo-dGTP diphosphatase
MSGGERPSGVPDDPLPEDRAERARLDEAYLARYRAADYPRPAVAVDLVLFTIADGALELLLIRRGAPPQEGAWALPGGFVRVGPTAKEQGEDVDAAAARELEEETGISAEHLFLEQFAAYGAPGRDPRMRVISVAYVALVRPELATQVKAGTDAAWAAFVPLAQARTLELAFDHRTIVDDAIAHIKRRLDRDPLAFALVPERFTVRELRDVYEILGEQPIDPGNFTRRVKRMEERGVVEQVAGKRVTGARPAKVYRFVTPAERRIDDDQA